MGVLSRIVGDVRKPARETVAGVGRRATSPLSIAGLGGAGAWAYKEKTDVDEEEARTDRYRQYQQRLSDIEDRYGRGEISQTRMEELKQQAREDYYNSNGSDNPDGLSFTELVAQMGTLQLIASAGVASLFVYFVLRPVAQRIATELPNVQEVLG